MSAAGRAEEEEEEPGGGWVGAEEKEGKMAMRGGLSGEVLLFRDCAHTPVPCAGMCASACSLVASERSRTSDI